MSTVTASPGPSVALRGPAYFLIRRLHSLTGVLFGGYIVVHLLINATLVEGVRHTGPTVYQRQVDIIHSLPFLEVIAFTVLLLPLIYHTIYGVYITVTGQPNVGNYPFAKNYFYTLQRVSAIVLVFFIAFHYLSFKGYLGGEMGAKLTFVPVDHATQSTVNHMHAAWWVGYLIYPIGILAATFHLSNGFWTAGVTWGLATTRKAQQRLGAACVGLFAFTTLCGFAALIAALSSTPSEGGFLPEQLRQGKNPPPAAVSSVD